MIIAFVSKLGLFRAKILRQSIAFLTLSIDLFFILNLRKILRARQQDKQLVTWNQQ